MSNDQQNNVDKEFIPYEEALALKELGFDEPCFAYYTVVPEDNINWFTISEQAITGNSSIFGSSKNYNTEWFKTEGTISAPTYSQAFRWFREKYNLLHNISYVYKKTESVEWFFDIKGINMTNNNILPHSEIRFEEYEKAEIACLRKLIEIVKKKQ